MLVHSRKVSLDEAWELLSQSSQDKNLKVSLLAERVIETGSLDDWLGDCGNQLFASPAS